MFPKIVLIIAIVALLSACTAPPAANPAPIETFTTTLPPTASRTSIPTPTLTPESPATPESFDFEVEQAKQEAIIKNAPNRIITSEYTHSDAFLRELEEKNAKGELPNISPNAFFVQPGTIDLRFDKEPETLFAKYGIDNAIRFSENTHKWLSPEDRPWVLVDAGYNEIGNGFFVVKWKNSDQSEVFWGYEFIPTNTRSVFDEFRFWFDSNNAGYPVPGMFTSVDGCKKFVSSYTNAKISEFCLFYGSNPESAVPKENLRNWDETGILKLDFLPWSFASSYKRK